MYIIKNGNRSRSTTVLRGFEFACGAISKRMAKPVFHFVLVVALVGCTLISRTLSNVFHKRIIYVQDRFRNIAHFTISTSEGVFLKWYQKYS